MIRTMNAMLKRRMKFINTMNGGWRKDVVNQCLEFDKHCQTSQLILSWTVSEIIVVVVVVFNKKKRKKKQLNKAKTVKRLS